MKKHLLKELKHKILKYFCKENNSYSSVLNIDQILSVVLLPLKKKKSLAMPNLYFEDIEYSL